MEIWIIYSEYVGGIVFGSSDKARVEQEKKEVYTDSGFRIMKGNFIQTG